ncbi:MAG TPA: hypothetical protein VEB86_01615, partial [Chryseosolibacter sp.]|nr:hypothetical protein [Chryseosolibacter sp.]
MEHLLRRLGLIESFSVRVASAKLFSDWFSKSVEIDPWDTTDRRKKQYKGSIDESGFEIRNKGERIPAFGGISFAKAIGRTRQSEDGFLVEVQIQLAPEQAMMFAAGCVIVTFLYIIPIGQLLDGDIELG